MTIVINFTNGGTMKDGYLRMWDGTKVSASNWELYDMYTHKVLIEKRPVTTVVHADGTFTDTVR